MMLKIMKNLVYASIFILANIVFVSAQTTGWTCPAISISGPSGIVMPYESAAYSVSANAAGNDLKLEYVWSVSAGEIVEGQGTQGITVRQPENQLTVTVELIGLPDSCQNTFSETSSGNCGLPIAEELNEFSGDFAKIDKTSFDKIIDALQNDSNAQLYIFNKYKKNTPRKKINKRNKEVKDYLVNSGIETERIKTVEAVAKADTIEFWLVPAGASPPTP